MLKGIYTALITPFKGKKIDEQAFQSFVEWQIKEGVHGLIPCGTTGESPTLTHDEHNRVIDLCIEVANGKAHVMAGTGSNSTEEAIMTTLHAKKAGADSALVVAPYYNRPTQEGIYQHYKALAQATKFPIIVYNIPGRSGVNITDETLARLATIPYIVGIKDATGDLTRPYTLRMAVAAQSAKTNKLALLSGEDMTAVAFNVAGGQGCISVASNIMPKRCAQVQEACIKGDYALATKLHETLAPLNSILFCETSPGPVKYAASLIEKCSPNLRLPLVVPGDESKKRIRQVLKNLRLI